MDGNDAQTWTPNDVYLRYTVIPGAAPRVTIASVPERVPQGHAGHRARERLRQPRVNRVESSFANRPSVVDRTAPYGVTLDSSGWPAGRTGWP